MPTDSHKEWLTQKYGAEVASQLLSLDDNIQSLYKQAVDSVGPNAAEIAQLAEPLCQYVAAAEKHRRRCRWRRLLLCFASIVVLLSCLIACETSSRFIFAITRVLWIKTLPYWDWTQYYSSRCFIRNPFYHEESQVELSAEDCQACEFVRAIERLANVSHSVISDVYIKRDVPLIVTDATDNWPARRLFSLEFLHKLYKDEEVLQRAPPCIFTSSFEQPTLDVYSLLTKAYTGELKQWYAHWENCNSKTVRLMRRFHRRPYFIPPMVEVVDRGWMFVSADYTSDNYTMADMSFPVMWLAQVRGANKIRLTPREPCTDVCPTLYTVLREGETVLWTDILWLLDYMPSTDTDCHFNVAVGSGGTFD